MTSNNNQTELKVAREILPLVAGKDLRKCKCWRSFRARFRIVENPPDHLGGRSWRCETLEKDYVESNNGFYYGVSDVRISADHTEQAACAILSRYGDLKKKEGELRAYEGVLKCNALWPLELNIRTKKSIRILKEQINQIKKEMEEGMKNETLF